MQIYNKITKEITTPEKAQHLRDNEKIIINNAGTHTVCKTQNINYGIENGFFVYYCVKCKKEIYSNEIENTQKA